MDSNSSIISLEGGAERRLTAIIAMLAQINAGRSSYISNIPPRGRTRYFQINTIAPPTIIPANAPFRLERFQNRAKTITGPKEAPKPAQAKETMLKIELSGSFAITTPTTAMATTVKRAASIEAFLERLI